MKVLLDTNIIVDVLQQREPWCEAGQRIFLAAAAGQIQGCITAKQLADIHFFSRKQFKGEDRVDQKARDIVAKLCALFELIDTLGTDCVNAIAAPNNDYEDAILMTSAARVAADCIVTRNVGDFGGAALPVLTPEQLLENIKNQN